jgi:hypothetical protein
MRGASHSPRSGSALGRERQSPGAPGSAWKSHALEPASRRVRAGVILERETPGKSRNGHSKKAEFFTNIPEKTAKKANIGRFSMKNTLSHIVGV